MMKFTMMLLNCYIFEKGKINSTVIEKNKELCRELESEKAFKRDRKFAKPYVFYCIMTLSVMLFALAFAASELFSLFFSEGYPGQMFLSKFFGFYATDEKSFKEILLDNSYQEKNITFKNKKFLGTTPDLLETTFQRENNMSIQLFTYLSSSMSTN